MESGMKLDAFVENDELAAGTYHRVHVSLRLKAQKFRAKEEQRTPMTVLFALDVSSSMAGRKLKQVCRVVEQASSMLDPQDRVGIMTFAKNAEVVCPVKRADADHLQRLRRDLRNVSAQRWTNFEAALSMAAVTMPSRRDTERMVVIFLSDGYASVGEQDASKLAKMVDGWKATSLSTLGFGDLHDGDLLELLSMIGGGRYHFISDPQVCEAEFSSALGAHQAVVAGNIEVTVNAAQDVAVVKALGRRNITESDDGVRVRLRDLEAESQQLLVLQTRVKTGTCVGPKNLGTVNVRYRDTVLKQDIAICRELTVRIAEETGSPSAQVMTDRLIAVAEETRWQVRRMMRDWRENWRDRFIDDPQVLEARRMRRERSRWNALARLKGVIDQIQQSPVYSGDDGSILSEICEDLREERKILKYSRPTKYAAYTNNNRGSMYDTATTPPAIVARPRRLPLLPAYGQFHSAQLDYYIDEELVASATVVGDEVVGRSAAADITIDHESLSRRHFQFGRKSGHFLIRDLGSSQGTYVNGYQIKKPKVLSNRDIVGVGDFMVLVTLQQDS